jgi:hypothetical protein
MPSRRGKPVLDDRRGHVQIAEIEFQFVRPIGRIERRRSRGAGYGQEARGHFRPVGAHDRNRIVAADAEAGQRGAHVVEMAAQPVITQRRAIGSGDGVVRPGPFVEQGA